MDFKEYDVVVAGAGSAGIAAAVSAARNGARVALVEAGPMLGGELLTGMTIDGAINGRGEPTVGGVLAELLDICRESGGFVAPLNDWRLIQYYAYDPEIMKIAIVRLVFEAGIDVMLHTVVTEVAHSNGRVNGMIVHGKSGLVFLSAKTFVDASGEGVLSTQAGAPSLPMPEGEIPQPVSMMFRMSGVETEPLLAFVRNNPENVAVGESDAIRGGRTDKEIVEELYKQGQPCVFFKGNGPFLGDAIKRGDMFATALVMIQPTSNARKEVCINATRISFADPTSFANLGQAMQTLTSQVHQCASFLARFAPGFENATLSGLAPRLGIRESRRVEGDYVMTAEDVLSGRKREDGVAKGCHHVDIHQDGTGQIRIPVADGGSYDIPLASLLPKTLSNVVLAGRCLSASREAQGSARVMGSCMAMGQAAGTLASLALTHSNMHEVRMVPVSKLRERLREQGAVLDGTH